MINLISPLQKEKIKQDQIFKVLAIFFILILAFLIVTIFFLKIFEVYLVLSKAELQSKVEALESFKKTKDLQLKEIEILQKKSREILSFEKEQKNFSQVLLALKQAKEPLAIEWENLFLSENEILLSGKAAFRQDLIEFSKRLKEQKIFSSLEFSPESWLKEKDVNFFLKIKLSWPSKKE